MNIAEKIIAQLPAFLTASRHEEYELDELGGGYKHRDIFHCEIRVGIEVEGWLPVSFLLGTLSNHQYKGHRSILWSQSFMTFCGYGTDQVSCQMQNESMGAWTKKKEKSKGEAHKEINIGSDMYIHIIFLFFNIALNCRMINEDFFLHTLPLPLSGSTVFPNLLPSHVEITLK